MNNQIEFNNSIEKVFYAEADYSQDEIDAVIDVLKNNRLSLMGGKKVKILEQKVSNIHNRYFSHHNFLNPV